MTLLNKAFSAVWLLYFTLVEKKMFSKKQEHALSLLSKSLQISLYQQNSRHQRLGTVIFAIAQIIP
jgi:hypothetical protein